jgi:AraC family transcriptional regulator, regulatory protein of adaptative response / DNA-3-methyladenine glycosylase II
VAQTRRLLFAKKLIDETMLSMTDVAFSAGYASIRRFNEAIRQTYGRTPSELRHSRQNRKHQADAGTSQLKLYYCAPLDWTLLLDFLRRRAMPGVEVVENNTYKRIVTFDDIVGTIEVRPVRGERYCLVRVPDSLSRYLLAITERVKRLFDLRANPDIIAAGLADDGHLTGLVRHYPGLRLPGAWDGFEVGVRAILGQQVSVKAATTFCRRLIETYGRPLANPDQPALTHVFPTPERIAQAVLTTIGLTQQRALTLQTFASAIANGTLSLHTGPTLDDAVETLLAMPGIGPWTANYIAMRALGEPDAFPAGDLILRRAASDASDQPLTERRLLQKAESWRPWRAYAAMLLWTAYTHQNQPEDSPN